MSVKRLTEHHLEFLSLKGGLSESKLVKMLNCWKSHGTAHMIFQDFSIMHGTMLSTVVPFKYSSLLKTMCY